MRRGFAVWLLVFALAAFAPGGAAADDATVVRTAHFEIRAAAPISGEEAQALAMRMEGRFMEYNRVFRFDPERLSGPLRVTAFRHGAEYESHVGERLGGAAPPGAVYLHFAQAELRELVIHLGDDGPYLEEALPFQAFIQFLRAFVPNPPLWIRDGFAIHFATLGFCPEGTARHRPNLVWLDAVKAMRPEIPPPEAVMRALVPDPPGNFPGLAWSLVSFFLNSGNEDYLRSFVESFMVMAYANTAEENTMAVANRIAQWNDMGELAGAHLAYIDSHRSFTRLVADGQEAYGAGMTARAQELFRAALEIRPYHYAPWYYLGLLAYNAGDTETAERYYRMALGFGADPASILYALALNAATADRIGDAVELLRRAAQAAPDRFGERAEYLIGRLESIRAAQ